MNSSTGSKIAAHCHVTCRLKFNEYSPFGSPILARARWSRKKLPIAIRVLCHSGRAGHRLHNKFHRLPPLLATRRLSCLTRGGTIEAGMGRSEVDGQGSATVRVARDSPSAPSEGTDVLFGATTLPPLGTGQCA